MARHNERFETPMTLLNDCVKSEATGELVVALESLEAHVFVCSGRIAWATSTQAPHTFSNQLARFGLERDTVNEAVADCRRSGRSLAETLVAWGVVDTGQIREAVRTQIAAALESLRLALGARFLFLRHSFSHSTEITFALSEVLGHQSHHPLKKEEEQP